MTDPELTSRSSETPRKRKSREAADLDRIQPLKEEYLRFFRRFPLQAVAADYIGRGVDCVQKWQKNDPWFYAEVQKAKAEWAEKNLRKMRPDNLMMHLYPEMRPPKQEIEQTGESNVTITYVHPSDTPRADAETGPDLAEAPGQDHN
jgi:hypothetical protein